MRTRARSLEGVGLQGVSNFVYKDKQRTTLAAVLADDKGFTIENSGSPLNPPFERSLLEGSEVTQDENHGFRDYPLALRRIHQSVRDGKSDISSGPVDNRGDVGGPFNSQKRWCVVDNYTPAHIDVVEVTSAGQFRRKVYDGAILARDPATSDFPSMSVTNLTPLGTTAIARCKPTNHISNLAADLTETFTQGLPKFLGHSLWKDRANILKGAGSEYLNSEFGWKPLVGDVRSAAYAVANSHRLIKSYESNSGKLVRRRYEFPIEETHSIVDLGPSDGVNFQGANLVSELNKSLPQPHLIKETWTYKRTWFSGGFTYHLPVGFRSRNWLASTYAKAGYLLGTELTPDTLWQVTPWTWAANWFSNMGDLVSNYSDWATDGLVLRYGYIMEHQFSKVTFYLDRPSRWITKGTSNRVHPITYFVESKRREKATPFGFGLDWNTFSPRQLAITLALGLTRL